MDKKYRLIQAYLQSDGSPYYVVQSTTEAPGEPLSFWCQEAVFDKLGEAEKAFERIKLGKPDVLVLKEWPAKS